MNDDRGRLSDLRIEDDAKADERPRGRALWIVLAIAVLSALAAGWFLRPKPPLVVTAEVYEQVGVAGTRGTVLEASGYVTARLRSTVSSKITARVEEILVEEGMRVAEGQILARLDDSLVRRELAVQEARLAEAESAMAETEVRLAEARRNLGRTERLAASEVASQSQVDADQAAVDSLAARLLNARDRVAVAHREVALGRQRIEDTLVRAPFAGVAISKDAQPGEMISPVSAGGGFTRTGICTLVDMSSLEIEVDVNESYINRVHQKQRVVASLDAYPGWEIPASVITTIPTADRQKATVQVRIGFDELDPRILPDMGVKVSFHAVEDESAAAPTEPRVLAPRAAIRDAGGQAVAWVVAGGKLERRAVSLGAADGEEIEVTAGLSPGERVVVEGPESLAAGLEVRIERRGGKAE